MNELVFNYVNKQIHTLNYSQYLRLNQNLINVKEKRKINILLETKITKIKCPHCNSMLKSKWGIRNGLQRYRCKICNKTYNSLTKTPLARLRKKEKWLIYSNCINNGLSVRKAATVCGVHKDTTFRWRHRFLKNFNLVKPSIQSGIIELKELYFNKSNKGIKFHASEISKFDISIPVVISLDRFQNVNEAILKKFTSVDYLKSSRNIIDQDSLVCAKDNEVFNQYCKINKLRIGKLEDGVKVKKEIVHLKNIENYNVKKIEWLKRFRGIGNKYIHNYLSWFRSLKEFKMNIPSDKIIVRAKKGGRYQPLKHTKEVFHEQ